MIFHNVHDATPLQELVNHHRSLPRQAKHKMNAPNSGRNCHMFLNIHSLPQEGKDFQFPAFYQLPPFFTLQPHAAVRAKQLELWKQLISECPRCGATWCNSFCCGYFWIIFGHLFFTLFPGIAASTGSLSSTLPRRAVMKNFLGGFLKAPDCTDYLRWDMIESWQLSQRAQGDTCLVQCCPLA